MNRKMTSVKNPTAQGRRPEAGPAPLKPGDDLLTYIRTYAQERPDVAALWCFGIGFVLGWKLKPW